MGKKKGKIREAGSLKTERKTARNEAKADRRRERTEENSEDEDDEGPDEDIHAILKNMTASNATAVDAPGVMSASERPQPPRRNFSFSQSPQRADDFLVFGGESWNGKNCRCYNELHVLRGSDRWFTVKTSSPPPPRDSHQACVYKGGLFVFGGMFTTPRDSEYLTYRDLWRLDIAEFRWEQIKATSGVPPRERCGHRMVMWKNFLVVYGGYLETSKQVQYFDDVNVFDLENYTWERLAKKNESKDEWPSARAGHQMAIVGDGAVVYGGTYRKTGGVSQGDSMTLLNDMWILQLTQSPMVWEQVRVGAAYKIAPRCGFSMVPHKGRLWMFGGAEPLPEDDETAVYMNDLHVFDFGSKRWHAVAPNQQNPHPSCRSHANVTMSGNTMIVLGGMVEVHQKNGKEQEVTMDDIWSIDLSKQNNEKHFSWKQLQAPSESVNAWIEESEDEDEKSSEESSEEEVVVKKKSKKKKDVDSKGTGLKGLCKVMKSFLAQGDHTVEAVAEELLDLVQSDDLSQSESIQFAIHALIDPPGLGTRAEMDLEDDDDGLEAEGAAAEDCSEKYDALVSETCIHTAAIAALTADGTDSKGSAKLLKWLSSAVQKHCSKTPLVLPALVKQLLAFTVVTPPTVVSFFGEDSQRWCRDGMLPLIQELEGEEI